MGMGGEKMLFNSEWGFIDCLAGCRKWGRDDLDWLLISGWKIGWMEKTWGLKIFPLNWLIWVHHTVHAKPGLERGSGVQTSRGLVREYVSPRSEESQKVQAHITTPILSQRSWFTTICMIENFVFLSASNKTYKNGNRAENAAFVSR